jgi:hypothetical protein
MLFRCCVSVFYLNILKTNMLFRCCVSVFYLNIIYQKVELQISGFSPPMYIQAFPNRKATQKFMILSFNFKHNRSAMLHWLLI